MSDRPPARLLTLSARVLDELPGILKDERSARRATMTEVEAATGIARATLHRVESGMPCTTTTAAKLLRWAAAASA